MVKHKRVLIIILSIVIAIIVAIAGCFLYYKLSLQAVSKESEAVDITIEEGMNVSEIIDLLNENGLIKNEKVFKLYTKINKINNVKAGEYELNKNMNAESLVNKLNEGPKNSTINITFIEGKNMRWIASKIAEKTSNTEEDVFEKLSDEEYLDKLIEKYWFITDEIKNENIYYSLEGYLFPDTYNFEKKATVEDIFGKMLDEMEKQLNPYKEEIQNSSISVHKILTVASIIELESSNDDDKAKVSSVIYNRLNKNMSIGSDVTTYYAIKVDMSERNLTSKDLNTSNPYNTRGPNMNGKLPVGPIASVSASSIKAALYPETTDYLYFVADKNGKIYFAKTIEEHNQNIANLKKQGLWYTYEWWTLKPVFQTLAYKHNAVLTMLNKKIWLGNNYLKEKWGDYLWIK